MSAINTNRSKHQKQTPRGRYRNKEAVQKAENGLKQNPAYQQSIVAQNFSTLKSGSGKAQGNPRKQLKGSGFTQNSSLGQKSPFQHLRSSNTFIQLQSLNLNKNSCKMPSNRVESLQIGQNSLEKGSKYDSKADELGEFLTPSEVGGRQFKHGKHAEYPRKHENGRYGSKKGSKSRNQKTTKTRYKRAKQSREGLVVQLNHLSFKNLEQSRDKNTLKHSKIENSEIESKDENLEYSDISRISDVSDVSKRTMKTKKRSRKRYKNSGEKNDQKLAHDHRGDLYRDDYDSGARSKRRRGSSRPKNSEIDKENYYPSRGHKQPRNSKKDERRGERLHQEPFRDRTNRHRPPKSDKKLKNLYHQNSKNMTDRGHRDEREHLYHDQDSQRGHESNRTPKKYEKNPKKGKKEKTPRRYQNSNNIKNKDIKTYRYTPLFDLSYGKPSPIKSDTSNLPEVDFSPERSETPPSKQALVHSSYVINEEVFSTPKHHKKVENSKINEGRNLNKHALKNGEMFVHPSFGVERRSPDSHGSPSSVKKVRKSKKTKKSKRRQKARNIDLEVIGDDKRHHKRDRLSKRRGSKSSRALDYSSISGRYYKNGKVVKDANFHSDDVNDLQYVPYNAGFMREDIMKEHDRAKNYMKSKSACCTLI